MSWWRPDDGLDPKFWGPPPSRYSLLTDGQAFALLFVGGSALGWIGIAILELIR